MSTRVQGNSSSQTPFPAPVSMDIISLNDSDVCLVSRAWTWKVLSSHLDTASAQLCDLGPRFSDLQTRGNNSIRSTELAEVE